MFFTKLGRAIEHSIEFSFKDFMKAGLGHPWGILELFWVRFSHKSGWHRHWFTREREPASKKWSAQIFGLADTSWERDWDSANMGSFWEAELLEQLPWWFHHVSSKNLVAPEVNWWHTALQQSNCGFGLYGLDFTLPKFRVRFWTCCSFYSLKGLECFSWILWLEDVSSHQSPVRFDHTKVTILSRHESTFAVLMSQLWQARPPSWYRTSWPRSEDTVGKGPEKTVIFECFQWPNGSLVPWCFIMSQVSSLNKFHQCARIELNR